MTSFVLTKTAEQFIVHWGEMGTRWGVNRTVSQIHALLYLAEQPLSADEIVDILVVARSNVSNSLKELQAWHLVTVVHLFGDRKDRFTTSKDIWQLFKLIVEGRKQREIDPTMATMVKLIESEDFQQESQLVQQQIQQTQQFLQILTTWSEEMLRQDPKTLMKILKMGSKISQFIRKKQS